MDDENQVPDDSRYQSGMCLHPNECVAQSPIRAQMASMTSMSVKGLVTRNRALTLNCLPLKITSTDIRLSLSTRNTVMCGHEYQCSILSINHIQS